MRFGEVVSLSEKAPTHSGGAPQAGDALKSEVDKLLACVHCGFCLPACPTYKLLGDENDSPRGRLHLMRAVAEGRLDPVAPAFQLHLERCLGCRACETVCPSGVRYGELLEVARDEVARAGGMRWSVRAMLALFARPGATHAATAVARAVRATGLPALMARLLPSWRWMAGLRLASGMLAASAPWRRVREAGRQLKKSGEVTVAPLSRSHVLERARGGGTDKSVDPPGERAALFLGCVQQGLFGHVNEATARVLAVNDLRTMDVPGQVCCGALHVHGGDLETARTLARTNIDAFTAAEAELVIVNAAGCGAVMKEYNLLLEHDSLYVERARAFAASVLDLSEVLAGRHLCQGAPLSLTITTDVPCHLLHAQGVSDTPAGMLAAVPGLHVVMLRGAEECCGGAGIYGVTHPDLGGQIGADKVAAVIATDADVVVTPNPGCVMQIGAGLATERVRTRALQPVEILDESYRQAGRYR